jgi:hypothetical protein
MQTELSIALSLASLAVAGWAAWHSRSLGVRTLRLEERRDEERRAKDEADRKPRLSVRLGHNNHPDKEGGV